MDNEKMGRLIRALRMEQGMTQRELAERVHVSDKAVSKWETGRGAPDISLLNALSEALKVNIEGILSGEIEADPSEGGNMKKTRWFYCPACGNPAAATGNAEISCCGRKLSPLAGAKPDEEHLLSIEQVEDEWYLTTAHPMTREHFIDFIAFVAGDHFTLIRQYPEWDLQQRIPKRHGLLLWHCSEHGLFSKNI